MLSPLWFLPSALFVRAEGANCGFASPLSLYPRFALSSVAVVRSAGVLSVPAAVVAGVLLVEVVEVAGVLLVVVEVVVGFVVELLSFEVLLLFVAVGFFPV